MQRRCVGFGWRREAGRRAAGDGRRACVPGGPGARVAVQRHVRDHDHVRCARVRPDDRGLAALSQYRAVERFGETGEIIFPGPYSCQKDAKARRWGCRAVTVGMSASMLLSDYPPELLEGDLAGLGGLARPPVYMTHRDVDGQPNPVPALRAGPVIVRNGLRRRGWSSGLSVDLHRAGQRLRRHSRDDRLQPQGPALGLRAPRPGIEAQLTHRGEKRTAVPVPAWQLPAAPGSPARATSLQSRTPRDRQLAGSWGRPSTIWAASGPPGRTCPVPGAWTGGLVQPVQSSANSSWARRARAAPARPGPRPSGH